MQLKEAGTTVNRECEIIEIINTSLIKMSMMKDFYGLFKKSIKRPGRRSINLSFKVFIRIFN